MKRLFFCLGLLLIFELGFSQIREFDPNKHELIGKEVPTFRGKTLDGKFFDLSDNRGKIVFMNFWSLKCSACFKEIEEINILKEKYKSVVFISLIREKEDEVLKEIYIENKAYKLKRKYLDIDKINYQIMPGLVHVMQKYINTEASPMNFIIDEKGILREFAAGYRMSDGNSRNPLDSYNYKVLDKKIAMIVGSHPQK